MENLHLVINNETCLLLKMLVHLVKFLGLDPGAQLCDGHAIKMWQSFGIFI